MSEQMVTIGFMIVLIGMALMIVGGVISSSKSKENVGFAFGGFIGPIPFGFANRKELLYLAIAMSIILAFVFLLGRKA